MRRSGNHAVIFWMLQNLAKLEDYKVLQLVDKSNWINNCEIFASNNVVYFNNITERRKHNVYNTMKTLKPNWVVVSYEDTHVDYSIDLPYEFEEKYKFSIVRDVRNLIASRLKRLEHNLITQTGPPFYFYIFKEFFDHYLSHKNWTPSISFDDWLVNKNYRDSICNIINVPNLDHTNYVSHFGGGSSFVNVKLDRKENLLNRKQSFSIPKPLLDQLERLNL